jgi:hypothetical protein
MRRRILTGGIAGVILTLVFLAPFWICPGAQWWNKVPVFVFWPAWVLMLPGAYIADAIHTHLTSHFDCRTLHTDWYLALSIVINGTVGAALGFGVAAINRRIRSNQASEATSEPAPGAASSSPQG